MRCASLSKLAIIATALAMLLVTLLLFRIIKPHEKYLRVAIDKRRMESLNADWNPYLFAAFYGNKGLANLAQLEFDEGKLENSLSASTVFISSVQGQEGNIFVAYLDCNTYECVGFSEAWMESWRETSITGYYPFDGVVAAILPLVAAEEAYWRSTGGVREGDGSVGREGCYAPLPDLATTGWAYSEWLLGIASNAVSACWQSPTEETEKQTGLNAKLILSSKRRGYLVVFEGDSLRWSTLSEQKNTRLISIALLFSVQASFR